MLGHLKFLLESERGEDLSLRRFSPLDYSMKLSGPVECPFEGCGFQTDLGKTMISHQHEVRHPGWNRHDTTREGQSKPWHCGLRTCQKAFPTWDGCYKHMQSHSKPLACPVCESFRTDRMPRLKKHLKEVHGQQNVGSGHFSRKSGSKFLAKWRQVFAPFITWSHEFIYTEFSTTRPFIIKKKATMFLQTTQFSREIFHDDDETNFVLDDGHIEDRFHYLICWED